MYKPIVICLFAVLFSCQQDNGQKGSTSETPFFDQASETEAIMSIIQNEAACFSTRDLACWKAHYAHVDYAFQGWNNADGSYEARVGWNQMNDRGEAYFTNHPATGTDNPPLPERKNMKVNFFNPGLAYLAWEQNFSELNAEGFAHSLETRLMEKMSGVWRIVNYTSFRDYVNQASVDRPQ